ncbi:transformer-2 sex-determining protein isoform X2 [Drosophila willistoni]|uniref:transformer-2 sex-determining protein isoform X2 n=1 Tax=Drosophila willistoni TaxID=7260 RepID=UPI001F075B14|nr:transformer-2 sex-determining protein isoform X2 [Drosophila willistoni]
MSDLVWTRYNRNSHNLRRSRSRLRSDPERSLSLSPAPRQRSGQNLERNSRDRHRMRHTRDRPQASRCIGVFGLNTNTTQHQVRELFNKFGPIERIQMVIDAHTHRSRGFCFIYYENLSDARVAKDACSGIKVDDRRIRVDYSITQRAHTPTPGVYMGNQIRKQRSRSRSPTSRRSGGNSRSDQRDRDRDRRYRSSHKRSGSRHRYDRSASRSRSRSRLHTRSRSPPPRPSRRGRGDSRN